MSWLPRPRTLVLSGFVGYLIYFVLLMQAPASSKAAFDQFLFSNLGYLAAINLLFYVSPLLILAGVVKWVMNR